MTAVAAAAPRARHILPGSCALSRAASQRLAGFAVRVDASARASWLAVFIPLLALYLVTARMPTSIVNFDPQAVGPSAWGLAHGGSPLVPASSWPANNHWFIAHGSDVVSNREPGLILLAAPLYLLFASAGPQDQFPSALAAALLTAAAMATLCLVLRRLAPARVALAAALIAGTATTTWTVSGTSLWPHGPDQLFLAVAMLGLASGQHARAGLAFAASVLVRPPLAVVALITGLRASRTRRALRPALVIGALTGLGVVAVLGYSARYWGGGIDAQYEGTGGDFIGPLLDLSWPAWRSFAVNVLGTVAAVGHGILFTSPLFIPLAGGLRAAWRAAPAWARSSAAGGLLYLAVQLKANRFNGGEGFWGYRYPIETLTLLAPLFVLSWQLWVRRTAARRAAFAALAIVSVTLEVVGATCFDRPDFYPGAPELRRHLAWLPANLNGVLIGPHAVAAAAVLGTGLVAAWLTYRRLARGSGRPDVLDVARADGLLAEGGPHDQPPGRVDVHGAATDHRPLGRGHVDHLAQRRAHRTVGRRQPGRLGVAGRGGPLQHAAIELGEDGRQQLGAVQPGGPAQRE
jgi:alpha-1,2-mannosyltransferase